jgi:hypothetical protein
LSSIGTRPRIFLANSPALVRTVLDRGGSEASSMTDRDPEKIDSVEAKGCRTPAPNGRDVVAALQSSPLADVQFDRITVKSKVRDINL